jgi:hypothetical protein
MSPYFDPQFATARHRDLLHERHLDRQSAALRRAARARRLTRRAAYLIERAATLVERTSH